MATRAGQFDEAEYCLTKTLRTPVAADDLFSELTSEESAVVWMSAAVRLDPQVGGTVQVEAAGWPPIGGVVVALDRPTLLAIRWQAADWPGPLLSTIRVTPDPGGALLSLTETGHGTDDDLLRRRDWLWSHWLVRLSAVAARA